MKMSGLLTLAIMDVLLTGTKTMEGWKTPKRNGKVIGGTDSTLEEFPWIVSLQKMSPETGIFVHFCGSGVILDEELVATVAHCVYDKKPQQLGILAGSLGPNLESGQSQQWRRVTSILSHPNYTTGHKPGPNDIALLKMYPPLTFGRYVKSIKLAEPGESYRNFSCCFTMGWGNSFPISPLFFSRRPVLQKVKTEVMSSMYCKLAYPFLQAELENTICASSGFFHGPCNGDSGNPLVCFREYAAYLLGLGSWGWVICGDGIHPDVYTDINLVYKLRNTTRNDVKLNLDLIL